MICIFPGNLCEVRNHTRNANKVKEMSVPQFATSFWGECESKKSARISQGGGEEHRNSLSPALCVPVLALPLAEQYHIKKQLLCSIFFIIYSSNFESDVCNNTDDERANGGWVNGIGEIVLIVTGNLLSR